MRNYPVQKLIPVTAMWRPNLAFMLRVSAEQRRAWASFNKRRNYMERSGRSIRYGDMAANIEIDILRREVRILHTRFVEWATAPSIEVVLPNPAHVKPTAQPSMPEVKQEQE